MINILKVLKGKKKKKELIQIESVLNIIVRRGYNLDFNKVEGTNIWVVSHEGIEFGILTHFRGFNDFLKKLNGNTHFSGNIDLGFLTRKAKSDKNKNLRMYLIVDEESFL